MKAFPFHVETIYLSESVRTHYFEITDIEAASSFLDDNIVGICCGQESDMDLAYTKRCLRSLFESKLSNETWIQGAVAEFFVHLFLNFKGFKQNFLYQNLEERSIKKGFDGVYSIGNDLWLMESKSGLSSSSITHYDKVAQATNDLERKVSGQGGLNDPWRNAYNHVSQIDVGAKQSIRSKIRDLTRLYQAGSYQSISSFNIIPCGTLYYARPLDREDLGILASKIKRYFSKRSHQEIDVVCVSNMALNGFISYLGIRKTDE